MRHLFARFANDESGATAIEYGLICLLIGLAIVASSTYLGNVVNSLLASDGDKLKNIAETIN